MDIYEFNLLDELIVSEPNAQQFKEFCNDLDKLSMIINPELYLEAMVDNNETFTNKVKKTLNKEGNTRKTTREAMKAYNDVTDAGGVLAKSIWDSSISVLSLTTKIITFIIENIAKVPQMIIKILRSIGNLPEDIRNKIRGNITLYITAEDIGKFHNQILPLIYSCLSSAKDMSEGDVWGTFFSRRPSKSIIGLSKNDMSYHRKMKSSFTRLENLKFQKTVVEIKNQNILNIYFGGAKSIKYTDVKGNRQESTYYDALIQLFNGLRIEEEFMKKIKKDIGEKFNRSQMNQSLAGLDESAQKHVIDSINMVSKIINIIGNLTKYVMKDMQTLKGVSEKILKKRNIAVVKESVEFI